MNLNPGCRLCPLWRGVKSVCMPGSGSTRSGLMIIAEAPGADEDQQNRPLVGRSGQLLNKLLAKAGIDRADVYTSNVVRCRPSDKFCSVCKTVVQDECDDGFCDLASVNWNRNPTPAEMKACWSYLDQEIQEQQPKVILLLGNFALKQFTGNTSITTARGKLLQPKKGIDLGSIKLIASLHPAYVMRIGSSGEDQLLSDIELAGRMSGAIKDSTLPMHHKVILMP